MVRLCVSLLAIALAAGPALAFSEEYERRSELDGNLYEREFVDSQEMPISRQDHEYFYGREASDGFEAREPGLFGTMTKYSKMGYKHLRKHLGNKGSNPAPSSPPPGSDDNGDSYRREISDRLKTRREELDSREFAEFLEARRSKAPEKPFVDKVFRAVHHGISTYGKSHANQPYQTYNGPTYNGAPAYEAPDDYGYRYSRGLERDEDLFERHLDAEGLFGREFDYLDERDIFDDLD